MARLYGDFNADDVVNVFDLSTLLSQWSGDGSADMNDDGVVDAFDLSAMLSRWNNTPADLTDAPANLQASASDEQVSLSWDAVDGANSYTIERSTNSGSGFTSLVTEHDTTSYDDTDVENGTTYYYRVVAVNDAGESDPSSEASATPASEGDGSFATALRLDGTNDYLTAPDSASLRTPTTALTIAGWVRFYDNATSGDFFNALLFKEWGASAPYMSYAIQQWFGDSFDYNFRLSNGTTIYETEPLTSLSSGVWYYLAGTWASGQNMVLRAWNQAGELVETKQSTSTVTATISYSTGSLYLGRQETGSVAKADLAGWLVHNAALSDMQLTTHRSGTFPVTASAGAWALAGEGVTEPDSSQSNHLTRSGGADTQVSGPNDTTAPTISSVSATPGDDSVTITWSTDEPATSVVHYGLTTSYGSTESESAYVTSHSITIDGLSSETEYNYKVVSTDSAGNTQNGESNRTFTTLAPQPPDAPTGLQASGDDEQAHLSWNAVSGATGYNIKRSTTSGTGYSTVESNHPDTNYTDTGLTNDTTYYYVVSAINANGESSNSDEASVTPNVPSEITHGSQVPTSSLVGLPPGWTPSSTVSGIWSVSNNQVIENVQINGDVYLQGPSGENRSGVVVRNCKINGRILCGYEGNNAADRLIENCEINASGSHDAMIGPRGYTVRRTKMHNGQRGVVADMHVVIEECWIYDTYLIQPDAHRSIVGTGYDGNHAYVEVIRSYLDGRPKTGQSSAGLSAVLVCYDDGVSGRAHHYTFTDNYVVAGSGAGYVMYLTKHDLTTDNMHFTGNIFTRHGGQFGAFYGFAFAANSTNSTWSNNTWGPPTQSGWAPEGTAISAPW